MGTISSISIFEGIPWEQQYFYFFCLYFLYSLSTSVFKYVIKSMFLLCTSLAILLKIYTKKIVDEKCNVPKNFSHVSFDISSIRCYLYEPQQVIY